MNPRSIAAILAGLGLAVVAAMVIAALWLPVNLPWRGMLFGAGLGSSQDPLLRGRIELPEGFSINIFASGVVNARFMQLTGAGDLIVASRDAGEIVLVRRDNDGDGRSDGNVTLASDLSSPHGVWLEGGILFVGEEHRIIRFDFDAATPALTGKTVVLDELPAPGQHYTRTVKRGPDGYLYVTIGSTCNACEEEHPWYAAMIRFREGEPGELFASGLRNTVGFDWQPGTGDLYGVDNGRDWLGDVTPPDELNRIERGKFYGWPYFNGANIPDPDNGELPGAQAQPSTPAAHDFAAHVAPLSITFLRHQNSTLLNGAALVAQHGSWNSTVKVGYQIVRLTWGEEGKISETPFITGFERDDDVIGRPVDIVEARDGAIYISDDFADVIYRVVYEEP